VFCLSPNRHEENLEQPPRVYLDVARTGDQVYVRPPVPPEGRRALRRSPLKYAHARRLSAGGAASQLVILVAPQWIGDAVMTEPLMRRLAARRAPDRRRFRGWPLSTAPCRGWPR
jgi:hypothetical protein